MQRRQFLGAMGGVAGGLAGAWAIGSLAGCSGMATHPGVAESSTAADMDAASFHDARRFVQTRHGRIAYVERGSGPAALFLHGFPLNSFQWRGALPRLAPYRRCIAPDLLGLGYTEVAPGGSVAPDAQVEMLAELLDRLGVDRVDLVANDSGGQAAQLFAARFPQRVRSLLLTNCDSEIECPPPALMPVIELARKGEFVSQWLAPWLQDKALARSPEGLGGMTFTYPDHPSDEAIDTYLTPLVRDAQRTHAYAIALDRNWLADTGPALRGLQAPVRMIWGTGDTIFTEQGAQHLDRAFARSQGVRRIEGAKLFFPEEFPDVIAEEARKLWALAAA